MEMKGVYPLYLQGQDGMKVVHRINAVNTARAAENPLHNDAAARKLGYSAGLIGGVDMYGYMTYAPVQKWGAAWLDSGAAECVLLKPVYEGDSCDVTITEDNGDSLSVELLARGEVCARSQFFLQRHDDTAPTVVERKEPYETRPAANPEALTVGLVLPTVFAAQTEAAARQFLVDEQEDLQIYTQTGFAHPGYLLRLCNYVLSRNLVLGPWIHTASTVQNFHSVPELASVEARGRVIANYEKRGHLMVDLEVQLVLDEGRIATLVKHSAIYKPREKQL